ncbi:MAG: flavodoxin domain-containing protein [Dehalococcoidia bacterium]|nr:flavodoxin domain-containing protein [Dehalococcoidia bacterium]
MAKVAIVYESSYGNTKMVAENIAEGLKKAGVEVILAMPKEVDWLQLSNAQAILIGSPDHMGNAVSEIRKFIKALGARGIKAKTAVFDTYMAKDFQKATGKMEKDIKEHAPGLEIIEPALSIRVAHMRGPIENGELEKCQAFAQKIAEKIGVKPPSIAELI